MWSGLGTHVLLLILVQRNQQLLRVKIRMGRTQPLALNGKVLACGGASIRESLVILSSVNSKMEASSLTTKEMNPQKMTLGIL